MVKSAPPPKIAGVVLGADYPGSDISPFGPPRRGLLLGVDQPGHQPSELIERTIGGEDHHPALGCPVDDTLLGLDHRLFFGECFFEDGDLLVRLLFGRVAAAETAGIIIDRLPLGDRCHAREVSERYIGSAVGASILHAAAVPGRCGCVASRKNPGTR